MGLQLTDTIHQHLAALSISLPQAPAPEANYVPFTISGNLIFVSGQISSDANGFVLGRLGDDMETSEGALAARRCGLALIAQVNQALDGKLDRLTRVVRLEGFVNATPEFDQHPAVINGASDLMVEVFGERGKHARAAVGVSNLPFGVAVEIAGIFEFS